MKGFILKHDWLGLLMQFFLWLSFLLVGFFWRVLRLGSHFQVCGIDYYLSYLLFIWSWYLTKYSVTSLLSCFTPCLYWACWQERTNWIFQPRPLFCSCQQDFSIPTWCYGIWRCRMCFWVEENVVFVWVLLSDLEKVSFLRYSSADILSLSWLLSVSTWLGSGIEYLNLCFWLLLSASPFPPLFFWSCFSGKHIQSLPLQPTQTSYLNFCVYFMFGDEDWVVWDCPWYHKTFDFEFR